MTWRENIKQIRNAHHHAHMMLHFGLSGCAVCAALDTLTAQIEELEAALRNLHSEVDCRIEHGAESGGHLEYVRERLALAQSDPSG